MDAAIFAEPVLWGDMARRESHQVAFRHFHRARSSFGGDVARLVPFRIGRRLRSV